jgi:hypothetical protein
MSEASARSRDREALLDEVLFAYLRAAEGGRVPDRREWLERYPELAAELAAFFANQDRFDGVAAPLRRVAEAARAGAGPAAEPGPAAAGGATALAVGATLGDFRLLGEVGRGGMGVVYEAEQQALGRRVALKVLLRPAAQDAKARARFRRESRAAAQLHHSNIVPVFDVGQQGELCYYAMQFIRGQALDQVVRDLQRLRAGSAPGAEGAAPAGPLAQSLWTGAFEPAGGASVTLDHERGPALVTEPVPPPAAITAAALPDHAELSSVASNYQRYCRNLARLGLQVAQALAYAHARGIIHRDIKPANLLLDTTGVLWVSDFGLAKTHDPAMTETGDLVGTLRYMAPERFRGECDARADVYALGLTLYELLVLRPAFDGQDRLHLVDQIGRQEPARLRVLDPRIPRDLETLLMKAIEKDPRRRYASADDLAEDLRRYLADEPIRARRIGPVERLGRWGRRNPLVAGLSAAIVLVTALGFVGVLGQWQVALANEQQANENAAQAEKERDAVKALNEKLQATQERLQRTLYAAHINLAQHAWEAGGVARVLELLEQHRPKPGEPDLRGFEWDYLYRLCHAELLSLKGYTGRVTSVAFSPDGKRLASAGVGGGVKVWDAQTGQELLTLEGRAGEDNSVAFSPDGKRLAGVSGFGGPDGLAMSLKVWDTQTGRELLTCKGLKGANAAFINQARNVAFSPDGQRLASAAGDQTVKVWDAQTGQELLTCKGHDGRVNSVAFSSNGHRLASGAADGTVMIWDATPLPQKP